MKRRYVLHASSVIAIKDALQQNSEFGGFFIKNPHTQTLLIHGKLEKGAHNEINLGTREIAFHTHPSTCMSRDACSLGMPSSLDMKAIATQSMHGNEYHIVFAREFFDLNAYVVSVGPSLANTLRSPNPSIYLDYIKSEFDALQQWYSDNYYKISYTEYRGYWFKKATQLGFMVKFFTGLKNVYLDA